MDLEGLSPFSDRLLNGQIFFEVFKASQLLIALAAFQKCASYDRAIALGSS